MKPLTGIFFCAALLLLCGAPAEPSSLYDPGLAWRSIKTDHFRIHYHQGLDDIAERMSAIAERVHDRLAAEIQWAPALRTDIVLVDNVDSANGYATPYPFNRVEIYVSRPEPDSILHNYDLWLESVFTHEYTHVLNFDTVKGIPQWGRYILGRNPLFYPNLFQPLWIIEGNAVFQESQKKPFGRNNSTQTDMIMRTEALNNNLKSIDKASSFPREWPRGKVPYLYGGLFVQYLEDTCGKGSFSRYMLENSDNIVPFSDNIYPIPGLFNKDACDVYGKPFFKLWKEWQASLSARYREQARKIEERGLTPITFISGGDDSCRYPRFSRDGKKIYYILSSGKKGEHLYVNHNEKNTRLCRVNSPQSLATGPGDEIILSDEEYYRSYSLYNEAFRYAAGRGYRKITSRLRGKYIDFAGSEGYVYIRGDRDRYSLVMSDRDFEKAVELISETRVHLSFVKVSPDGKKAVFAIKDDRGFNDLVLMDLSSGTMLRLTADWHNDLCPAWHPGGESFIFVSDRSGVHNLYEYSLRSHRITRITNVTGGLYYPDISPDGSTIAVASYEKNGFRIGLISYPDKAYEVIQLEPEVLDKQFFIDDEKDPAETPAAGSRPYTPWSSLFPAFYIPVISTEEFIPNAYDFAVGLWVQGSDTLSRHSYYLALYYYIIQTRFVIEASYTLSVLYPDITIGYYDETIFFDRDQFPYTSHNSESIRRNLYRYGYLSNLYSFIGYRVQQYLQCTYYLQQEIRDTYIAGRGEYREENLLGKMQFTYALDNANTYLYSISREHGRDLVITADIYHKYLGSDKDFYKLWAQYSEYLPGFYANNVILLRFRGAICLENEDERPYSLGRYNDGSLGDAADGEDTLGLRGYPAGVVTGNRLIAGTLEMRFPLVQKDAGLLTVPVMFRDFWMTAFFDCGCVFDGSPEPNTFAYSAGAELHLNLTLGYNVDINTLVGYAFGFTSPGEHQVYFAISSLLEGAFAPGKNRYRRLKPIKKEK